MQVAYAFMHFALAVLATREVSRVPVPLTFLVLGEHFPRLALSLCGPSNLTLCCASNARASIVSSSPPASITAVVERRDIIFSRVGWVGSLPS